MPSSQPGGSAGGSQSQGPTSRTFPGQSERGYSNGSAVMYRRSGGAENASTMSSSGGRPSRSRLPFTHGATVRSSAPTVTGRSNASRARPTGLLAGRRPSPKGGASREGIGSGYGHHAAQGKPR